MCRENIEIALCAPNTAPHLPISCGRLHLVASHRETCDAARGSCACFFGTCGKIDTVATSQTVDWAVIPKVQCEECTKRGDENRHQHESIELGDSPLLNKVPIPQECLDVHMDVLKKLWKGADKCTIHPPSGVQSNETNTVHDVEAPATEYQTPATPASVEKSRANSFASAKHIDETVARNKSEVAPQFGIESSRWAPEDPERHAKGVEPEQSHSRHQSISSARSSKSQKTQTGQVPGAMHVESVFTLKNLPETLPDFSAMKAFLARA